MVIHGRTNHVEPIELVKKSFTVLEGILRRDDHPHLVEIGGFRHNVGDDEVPSVDVLKERLNDRGTETKESLSRRLFKAEFEMGFSDKFDVVLINEDLSRSLAEAQRLYDDFKKT